MLSLKPGLQSLLKALQARPDPKIADELVHNTLNEFLSKSSAENRKSQWEYVLKNEIFMLAATEGNALKTENTTYYEELREHLDLILTFTEHGACEQTFPFIVLEDLLETQTIASCSHIFSWIEARSRRLTEGMVPQRGKALILLRTLNDLLRRLSKMGSTTMFCGRILTFLSGVFPLGERSGVNLRGEYGPTWEGVKLSDKTTQSKEGTEPHQSKVEDDKMQVETRLEQDAEVSLLSKCSGKEEFYNTFWSLQLPFSHPPLFATPNAFPEFRDAVNRVLPVIKEATAKERAMMGSRSVAGTVGSLKRKREPEVDDETSSKEYFFAKFLTSPELLDLEIADTHFRRQVLFQLLILLNHLLMFTKTAKATWSSARNRSLQMDFTLDGTDAQWVQETVNKVMDELRQTTPNGRAFAETVNVVLDREKNWVKWKNELCAPFDKESWSSEVDGCKVGLEEATQETRKSLREQPKDWPWKLGSEPLTEIWEMGYRDLDDLKRVFHPGEVKDFVKKIKQEDARIELRRKVLGVAADRAAQMRAKVSSTKEAASSGLTTAPPVQSSSDRETVTVPKTSQDMTASTPDVPLAVPRSIPTSSLNQTSSPLHPSLPPKPGSPIKPLPPPDIIKVATPTVTPVVKPVPAPVPIPIPPPPPPPPKDELIAKYEDNKQRWSWLCLRTARDQHLQHFVKISTGDIMLLASEIEKENKERESMQKGDDVPSTTTATTVNGEEHGSPMVTASVNGESVVKPEAKVEPGNVVDGDVKMEGL